MIYTSGSTGRPKGVLIEHKSLLNYIFWLNKSMGSKPGDITPLMGSISFDATISSLLAPLLVGMSIEILSQNNRFSFLVRREERDRPFSYCKITPSHLKMMNHQLDSINHNLKLPHTLLIGGEALEGDSLDWWVDNSPDTQIINEYGPTETVVGCTAHKILAGSITKGKIPIGLPIDNTQIFIINSYGQILPHGSIGELVICGDGVGRGYHNMADTTAEKFVDLYLPSGKTLSAFRSGDLARWNAQGYLEYYGRKDTQVKLRGYRIELGEIKMMIQEHPAVIKAVVLVDKQNLDLLKAYVKISTEKRMDIEQVRAFVEKSLPNHMCPANWIQVDEFPLTQNGKLDLDYLDQLHSENKKNPNNKNLSAQPSSKTNIKGFHQKSLAGLWEDFLGCEVNYVEDDFFLLGGYSILASRLVSSIQKFYSVDVELAEIFDHSSIGAMSVLIKERKPSSNSALDPQDTTQNNISYSSKDEAQNGTPLPMLDSDRSSIELSIGQERFWILDQISGPNPVYNVPFIIGLNTALDRPALTLALDALAQRHSVFQTSIQTIDGKPELSLQIKEAIISKVEYSSIEKFIQKPFIIDQEPLYRWGICNDDQLYNEYGVQEVFISVLHHLITDGWSSSILIQELSRLYSLAQDMLKNGRRNSTVSNDIKAAALLNLAELPKIESNYYHFSKEQRNELILSKEIDTYWTKRLQDASLKPALYPDYAYPSFPDYKGRVFSFEINKELSEKIHSFGQEIRMTPYMTFFSLWALFLMKRSSVNDITLGTAVSGRTQDKWLNIVGYFVNTLAVNFRSTISQNLLDYFTVHRAHILKDIEHQNMPFDRLIDLINVERNASVSPVFQSFFVFQDSPASKLQFGENECTEINIPLWSSRYELTLAMDGYKSGSGSYECSFEYFSSLFTEHSIEDLSISFRYFLEHISSIRQKKKLEDIVTSDLQICPPQHISKINSWNSTQKKYQEPSFIFDIIQGSFQKYAKEDALTFGSQSITYKQLDLLTLDLAQRLRSIGLNGDDIVAVVMDRSIEMVVTILGIIRAGCAYMPLDPDSPKKRIQMILEDSKASLVFCNTQDIIIQHQESNSQDNFYLIECCLNPGSNLNITPDIDSIIDDHELIDLLKNPIIIKNTDLAYVIFTSGSTGQPKGVGNTYGALRNRLLWMQEKYPIGFGDVLLQKTPSTFDVSVWEFFWPFMYGARLHILEPALHGDPYHLYDIMKKENISVVHFVPSILKVFLNCIETFQLPYLKHVISSGESLSWKTLELFYQKISQSELHNLYGPTEAAIDVSSWDCDRNQYDKNISIGSPVSNTQLHILNPDGKTQPIGVPGELYIGGIQLARGYLNSPELTEKSFIQSDLAIDSGGQRLYRTGDLARWQWDGTIEFLGRIDHQVKIRGNRIELGEIEAHLLNLDHVKNAIVDVRIGPAGQQLLIAWVQSSLPNYADDCRSHLLENLPVYMIPSNWVSIQEIPLNKNGKLDRKKLPKPNFVENEDIVPANSQLERKLIDLFCQVLGLQNTDHQTQVYTTSNFFTLGGDSILVIMFINEARKKDIEFSPTDLFRFQTPKALADHIKSHIAREEIKYDPTEIQGPFPYTPALKWFRAQSKGRMLNWYNQSSNVVPLRDLKAEYIQETLNLLVKMHPSLRVRVQSFSELCILDSDTPNQFPLEIEKFSLNKSDSFETSSVISKILKKHQSSLNIYLDGIHPLGIINKAIWFRSDQLEHQRLVFISHHIAVDAQTWPILLNDFEKIYPKIENQNFNFDKYNSGHSIVNYANALNDDYLASKHSIHLNVPSGSIEKAKDTIIIPKMGSLKSKSEQFGISLEVLLLGTLAKSIGISVTIHRESTGRNLDQYNLECGSTAGWFTAVRALFYDADIDLISNLRTIQSKIINNQYNEPKHTAEHFNDYEPNGKNSKDSIKSGIDNCILFNFLGMIDLGESSDTLIFGKAPERELFSINPEYQAYPLEVNITLIHDQINIQLSVNSRFDKTGWGKELSSSYKLNKVCKILLKQWEKTLLEFQKEFHQSDHTSLLPVDQYQDRQNKTKPELQSIETKGSTFQYLVNISNNNSNLPNLFCVHPMGGTVFCYQKLAQSLPKYSVSAFQAQGLSQGEDPLDRVDQIASNYVKELQSYYPSGEILLLGWSFGGMVAAEMARQLQDQDRTIKWVGLLDIHAPGTIKDKTPSSDQAQLLYEIFAQDLDFNKRVLPPLNPDERLTFIAERGVANGIFPLGFGLAEAKLAWNTYMEHFKAEENFSLEKFNQKIPMSVIRSNQRSQEDDKTMGWGEYMIDKKNIYDIDTIHLNLLREPFLIHLIKLIKLI
jgi:amino acid adenylation domain-containing protein